MLGKTADKSQAGVALLFLDFRLALSHSRTDSLSFLFFKPIFTFFISHIPFSPFIRKSFRIRQDTQNRLKCPVSVLENLHALPVARHARDVHVIRAYHKVLMNHGVIYAHLAALVERVFFVILQAV